MIVCLPSMCKVPQFCKIKKRKVNLMYLKAANPCSSVLFASHSLFGFLSSTCCGCLPFMFYLLLGLYSLFVTVGNGSNEQIPKVLFMLMCIIVFGILTMDKGTCKELTVLKNDPKP